MWICFCEIWILSIFGVHLFSRMVFKRKLRLYLILYIQLKFEKFTKICTRNISTLQVDKNRRLPYLHFKRLVCFKLHLQLFCSIFLGSKILAFAFVIQRDFLEMTCICNICLNCKLLNIKRMDISSSWKVYLLLCQLSIINYLLSVAFYSCREKLSLKMNMVCRRLKKKAIRH